MNIFITGGSGFVGRNLVRYFAARNRVTFSYLRSTPPQDLTVNADKVRLDIRNADHVVDLLKQTQPAAVIHVAGNKNVKECERRPEEAFAVNAAGPQNIARACREVGAQMVYLSTDLVFESTSGGYRETDRPRPNSAYGRTKFAGEELAAAELDDFAVCRSGGLYGFESPLLLWLAEELKAQRPVECLTNVWNTPTYVENLAEMIGVILRRRLTGTFHTVGSEVVNRFQFFSAFAAAFDLNARALLPVESEQLMQDLLLHPNSALDSTWTTTTLGVKSLSVNEGMTELRSTVEAKSHAGSL
jgi:dTDP-4-dehydrorhamnose reductase